MSSKTTTAPRLQMTRNYDLFELHPQNREVEEDRKLDDSFKKYGYIAAFPLLCVPNGDKEKIMDGHRRFMAARKHGTPVYWVRVKASPELFHIQATQKRWTGTDFAKARANAGDSACRRLVKLCEEHHLPIGAAASLLGGNSAGGHYKLTAVKEGKFTVAEDSTHMNAVLEVLAVCREYLVFATTNAFISALSLCVRIPHFDREVFCRRVRDYGAMIPPQTTRTAYLAEIERLYNYTARSGSKFPVAFEAQKISRNRKDTFGGRQESGGMKHVDRKPKGEAKREVKS
jgi:hypothetical protein